jgi:hypothetical protein
MRVLCINDKNRPNEVPLSQWIKKDEKYTVIKVMKHITQGNIMGFELAEVKIDAGMYKYFAASRFAPIVDPTPVEIEKLEELTV